MFLGIPSFSCTPSRLILLSSSFPGEPSTPEDKGAVAIGALVIDTGLRVVVGETVLFASAGQ